MHFVPEFRGDPIRQLSCIIGSFLAEMGSVRFIASGIDLGFGSIQFGSASFKARETFCGCFGPIRNQRRFRVKISAIVRPRVSSYFYKFQPDRSYLCLTLVLNQIGSLVIRLRDENSFFFEGYLPGFIIYVYTMRYRIKFSTKLYKNL